MVPDPGVLIVPLAAEVLQHLLVAEDMCAVTSRVFGPARLVRTSVLKTTSAGIRDVQERRAWKKPASKAMIVQRWDQTRQIAAAGRPLPQKRIWIA